MASRFGSVLLTATLVTGLSAGLLGQQGAQSSDTARPVQARAMTPDPSRVEVPTAPDVSRGAIIGARDHLRITTVDTPEFTKEVIIDADGTFDFGFLGRIKGGGLTVRQLEDDLKRRLVTGKYLTNPQVTIDLIQQQAKRVFVSGMVRNPSPFPFTGRLTVMEALLDAGGVTEAAGDNAFIVRANADGSVPSADEMSGAAKIYVDLHKLIEEGDASQNYTLNDGDYVYVEKALPFTIDGEVKTPGQYPARRGLTVQQAVALAGGLTDRGKNKDIKILRPTTNPKKPQTIDVKDWATEQVKPGDTLQIPRRIM